MKINELKGVGPKTIQYLNKMGIDSVNALVTLYPRRYENFTLPVCISNAQNESAVLCKITDTPSQRGKSYMLHLNDGSGELSVIWFHVPYKVKFMKKQEEYVFYGKLTYFNGYKQMVQPQVYEKEEYLEMCGHLMPVYPLTAGIKQSTMRKIVGEALSLVENETFDEYLPEYVRTENHLINYKQALRMIHSPVNEEELKCAMKRIKYNELFLYLLKVSLFGKVMENNHPMKKSQMVSIVLKNLSFSLTDGQMNAWLEIESDMSSNITMRRMIQGDVGSGKSIISFLTLFMAVDNGYQGALMAPTEVLAKQHYEELCSLILKNNLPIRCELLAGSVKNKAKIYKDIKDGFVNIIVGTHAIIQKKVEYNNLGVVITDEEHRFGVGQRQALSEKGNVPHTLIMSATPIPRSLAMTMYADMKVSIIKGLPSNRKPIQNAVIFSNERIKAWSFINMEIKKGRQAYVICPMVDETSEDMADITSYVREMQRVFPKDICIAGLHGKMTPEEKNDIMKNFSDNVIQILVATTVVEVGVNVPNATVILIEDANMFGMSQLHQLRGRVGRGSHQSYCIFLNHSDAPCERLEIMRGTNDGFVIAEEDMRLRGTGNLLGTNQSGNTGLKLANLFDDKELIEIISENIGTLLRVDPNLITCPRLKEVIEQKD